jgi:hypothetical protein
VPAWALNQNPHALRISQPFNIGTTISRGTSLIKEKKQFVREDWELLAIRLVLRAARTAHSLLAELKGSVSCMEAVSR